MLLRNIKCNSEAAAAAVQSVVHESRRPASAASGRGGASAGGGNAASVASGGGGSGGGGPATIDSILRLVGDNPGSTTCGYFTLKRIWVALSACVSDTMLKAKGVCIPGFATLSFRKVTAFRGNWGMKLELHPTFHLHPLFSRTYNVSTGGGSSQSASVAGAVSSAQLNTSAMAIKAGVSKDACVNALKDVWRRLGDVAYRGGAVSVDLGVARVAIRGGRCDVAWNASFLAQMDRYCANLNNKALRRSGRTSAQHSAYAANTLVPQDVDLTTGNDDAAERVPRPLPLADADAMPPPRPARPGSAGVPQPHTPSLSAAALHSHDHRTVSQVRANLNSALDYARHEEASSRAPSQHSEIPPYSAAPSPSCRNEEAAPPTTTASQMGTFAEKARGNEKWTRRLRNKALHRRLRNKAYALAWEEQRRQRAEQLQQERASDADRMKITHQQEDLQRRRAERDAAERLALARRIQVENIAATDRRRSAGPAAVGGGPAPAVGDTYWGRCEAPPAKPSGAGIRAGIEAIQSRRKEQATRVREEEQAAFEAQRRQWDDEDERRRERRRAEKAALLEEYRSHMAGKAAAASAGRSGLGTDSSAAPSPPAAAAAAAAAAESNFIFHGRTAAEMVEDEQKERRDRRAAAVAVQKENKRAVESAQKAKRVSNGMRKYADKRHLDKTVQRELYTDGDVLHDLQKRQQELRAAWDGQIKERKELRARERRNIYSASTLHAWRNESSDEEYDDFQQNRIVHHPLVH